MVLAATFAAAFMPHQRQADKIRWWLYTSMS